VAILSQLYPRNAEQESIAESEGKDTGLQAAIDQQLQIAEDEPYGFGAESERISEAGTAAENRKKTEPAPISARTPTAIGVSGDYTTRDPRTSINRW